MEFVAGVLLVSVLAGSLPVAYRLVGPDLTKHNESDFMKALERRKIVKDKDEFISLPVPFVPIDTKLLTDLCQAYGKRKDDEPQYQVETNFLYFKMRSNELYWHPVKAEMFRCNYKYAIMDIGHASHLYILKRGHFRKKYQKKPLFHISGIYYLKMVVARSRATWLDRNFPEETHHWNELPTQEEIDKMNKLFGAASPEKKRHTDSFLH